MVSAYLTEVKNIHQFTSKLAHINRTVNQVAAPAETPDPNCVLTTNSDITGLCNAFPWNFPTLNIISQGVGIRVAFYFQGLVTIFGPL